MEMMTMTEFVIHYADRHELSARCGRKAKVATVDLHAVSCLACKRTLEPPEAVANRG